jgi:hypothetical protein
VNAKALYPILYTLLNFYVMVLDGTLGVPMFNLFGQNSPSSHTSSMSMNIFNILQKPVQETPDLPSMFHRLAPHDSPTPNQGSDCINVFVSFEQTIDSNCILSGYRILNLIKKMGEIAKGSKCSHCGRHSAGQCSTVCQSLLHLPISDLVK